MVKRQPKRTGIRSFRSSGEDRYDEILTGVTELLEASRRASARSLNAIMTATYWEIGRRIVENEQAGVQRAEYGSSLLKRLAGDLSGRFGRGFSKRNLEQMRRFYLSWPIAQTPSAQFSGDDSKAQMPSALWHARQKGQTPSDLSRPILMDLAQRFPLPWSHYVRLMAVTKEAARRFYETEAIRGGWSVRQLERQIGTQFYERTLLSRKKTAMLIKGQADSQLTTPALAYVLLE